MVVLFSPFTYDGGRALEGDTPPCEPWALPT